MRFSPLHFFPVATPFLLGLLVLIGFVIALIEIGVIQYAYERIGVGRRYVFSILALSLLGSYVNIPVAELPPEQVITSQIVNYFGMQYVVPHVEEWPRTVIALNLGGAIVPALLSLYLIFKNRLFGWALAGVGIVAAVTHAVAHPVPGVGIAVPVFVPPLVAAGVALLLARRSRFAPALAYVSGSLGTLIGADLLNLGRVQGLGAPVASIGGAGTFDGIFVAGIVAVLLA